MAFGPSTGCDQLAFNPALSVPATTGRTLSPTGFELDVVNPQPLSPTQVSPSQLRAVAFTNLSGLRLNQAAAAATPECSEAEAGPESEGAATCPPGSAVGVVTFSSLIFAQDVSGTIFYGGAEPESGRLRFYLIAAGGGATIKQVFFLTEEAEFNTLIGTLEGLPQLPLSEIDITIFDAAGASLLRTRSRCGDFQVPALLQPWDAKLSPQVSFAEYPLRAAGRRRRAPATERRHRRPDPVDDPRRRVVADESHRDRPRRRRHSPARRGTRLPVQ